MEGNEKVDMAYILPFVMWFSLIFIAIVLSFFGNSRWALSTSGIALYFLGYIHSRHWPWIDWLAGRKS